MTRPFPLVSERIFFTHRIVVEPRNKVKHKKVSWSIFFFTTGIPLQPSTDTEEVNELIGVRTESDILTPNPKNQIYNGSSKNSLSLHTFIKTYICAYICIYTYKLYIHVYIPSYIHIYMYSYLYTRIYIYIHIYVHAYIYIYSYLYTLIYIYIYIFISIYTHTFIYIYSYLYTRIYISSLRILIVLNNSNKK